MPHQKWRWISKDKVHNFNTHTWRAVDGSARVTPLWATTDLYWHGLTLQRIVLAPTPFWLQIRHQRENESFSLPFADLPLLTGGWLTCFIRRRSVPKCRSCRKDSSGAVKSVQPGCSWIQFPWPANSLVAIYSEVRFLMSGVSNLFCLQGIWQSKKQLLRTAQTVVCQLRHSQNCGGQRPAHSSQPKAQPVTLALSLLPAGPQTGTTAYFNSCSELQETTNQSTSWLEYFRKPLSDKMSLVVIVFKTSLWPPAQELCMKQRVWNLIYSWSATTINYTDRKNASLLLERWPSQNAVLLRCLTTTMGMMDEDLHTTRNIHFYWAQGSCEVAAAL